MLPMAAIQQGFWASGILGRTDEVVSDWSDNLPKRVVEGCAVNRDLITHVRGTSTAQFYASVDTGLNSYHQSSWRLNASKIVYSVSMSDAMTAHHVLAQDGRAPRRPALQGSMISPFTKQLLKRAGATNGMRVLDLGCCVGDRTV